MKTKSWQIVSNLRETKGFHASTTHDFNIKGSGFFPGMLQKPLNAEWFLLWVIAIYSWKPFES